MRCIILYSGVLFLFCLFCPGLMCEGYLKEMVHPISGEVEKWKKELGLLER